MQEEHEHDFAREPLVETLRHELQDMERDEQLWRVRTLGTPSAPHARVDGKPVLVLCSNNYLGLANNPRLKQAAISAVRRYGAGSGSVRVIAGTMTIHKQLEKILGEYKKSEASIVFQSGYATNLGTIMAMVGDNDLIISDELNHGSIIDGCRLTKADRRVYRHADVQDLEKQLQGTTKYRRVLIVTDGVFSMDGDIAPLPDIVRLANEYGAVVYVDDAHGDGVLGDKGRGISSHFNLHGKVDIEMGTFSKAFGVVGGYVVGSEVLCSYLQNKVRSYLLSGSHPPSVVGACIAALQLVQRQPSLVKKLWDNTRYFKKGLQELGFDTGHSETPITPIMVGDARLARKLADAMFELKVFVLPIFYPIVGKDKARIRTIVTSAHSKRDLDYALDAFGKAGKRLGVI